jgi:hypothetical protein
MGRVEWSDDAVEDLHRIPDNAVCAEIMDLAETELKTSPDSSPIEGFVAKYPDLWWRRGVRRADIPQFLNFYDDDDGRFSNHACDYVIVYRLMTSDEKIRFRRMRNSYVVVRVLHNREFPMRYRVS